jgi:glutathione synthase/RimK-type ligase-like ATP-grasp enzyme
MTPAEIWRSTTRAKSVSGHPRWRQLAEMLRLRTMPNKIKPHEYFGYRLYRPELSFDKKREYIGSWTRDGVYAPNDPADAVIANCKLSSYELFDREGLPHPRMRAVVNIETSYKDCAALSTAAEVAALLSSARYPLFIKPNRSHHGWGGKLVDAIEHGVLQLRDGSRVAVEALAAELTAPKAGAMLIQDAIVPHATIAAMTGGIAATARVLVLLIDGRPSVHSAVLRVPVGNNMVDNFYRGLYGNMIAEIDVATGVCAAAVADVGLSYRAVDHHPDTGNSIRGLQMPEWPRAVEILERAARHFPGLQIQGWDIAFDEQGPMLLENNSKSEFNIIQHATQRGLLDTSFRRVARL